MNNAFEMSKKLFLLRNFVSIEKFRKFHKRSMFDLNINHLIFAKLYMIYAEFKNYSL